MNVVNVKLTDGHDIIAELVDEQPTHIVLKNPCVPIAEESNNVKLIPWMMFSSGQDFQLNRTAIAVVAPPNESLAEGYKSQFSQIITPKKEGIIVG